MDDPKQNAPGRLPKGVKGLVLFFSFGAVVSFLSAVSLLVPGGTLEPMWRINPEARVSSSERGAGG